MGVVAVVRNSNLYNIQQTIDLLAQTNQSALTDVCAKVTSECAELAKNSFGQSTETFVNDAQNEAFDACHVLLETCKTHVTDFTHSVPSHLVAFGAVASIAICAAGYGLYRYTHRA